MALQKCKYMVLNGRVSTAAKTYRRFNQTGGTMSDPEQLSTTFTLQ